MTDTAELRQLAEKALGHIHNWKDAPDWTFAPPGHVVQECFGCRRLRVAARAALDPAVPTTSEGGTE